MYLVEKRKEFEDGSKLDLVRYGSRRHVFYLSRIARNSKVVVMNARPGNALVRFVQILSPEDVGPRKVVARAFERPASTSFSEEQLIKYLTVKWAHFEVLNSNNAVLRQAFISATSETPRMPAIKRLKDVADLFRLMDTAIDMADYVVPILNAVADRFLSDSLEADIPYRDVFNNFRIARNNVKRKINRMI